MKVSILVFLLAVAAVAYGISYLILLSTPTLDTQTRLIISGVLSFLVLWGTSILAPKL